MVFNSQELLDQVLQVSENAVAFIRDSRKRYDEFGTSAGGVVTKGSNDFATEVDLGAERMLVDGLRPLIAGAAFITEEGTIEQVDHSIRWIVDPLDGTTNFMHGIPNYAVSVALEVDGVLELGMVWEVSGNECFTARRGEGAWLGDRRLQISGQTVLSECLTATGFPYDKSKIGPYAVALAEILPRTKGIRRLGAAAVDLAYVAAGRHDAYYEKGLNSWDAAAGTLLVREAGGVVRPIKAGLDAVHDGGLISGAPGLVDEIASHISGVFYSQAE